MDGIRSSQIVKLREQFVTNLKEYLQLEGLRKSHVDQYFFEAGEIIIGKTNSRSVIGTMTEMSLYCNRAEFNHTYDLSSWLNNMIYKPIDYEEPITVFKNEITKRYQ